ncbi:MAG: hypothetical protein ABI333_17035 [bacterium]
MIQPYSADEDLLQATREDGAARIRVYRFPYKAVVLGRGSRPSLELRQEACHTDGVKIHRRRGGGCAVVLDPGNVIVSAALSAPGLRIADHFETLSAWLIRGLARAGVPDIVQRDISDLCLGDHKIAGACMYRARNLLFYSASLLVDPDVRLMERYLHHPPREPEYRRGRPHAQFVTSVRGHTGLNPATLAERLEGLLEPPDLDARSRDSG